MGVGGIIGHFLGKWTKVPVKDGIMNPVEWSYAEKIKDLAQETNKVAEQYIANLADEAMRRHDFAGLKVIFDYVRRQSYNTDTLLQDLIHMGRELRLEQWMHSKWGNPFGMVESVVRFLC